jgi:hypothetical protein
MSISMPIYYTEHFKTKPSNTFLVGFNWYRNAYHHQQNKVKQDYLELVKEQVLQLPKVDQFYLKFTLYYKNPSCDGGNIVSLMEKFILDILQKLSVIPNDNIKYHLGSTWCIGGQDKDNPRVEVTLINISEV